MTKINDSTLCGEFNSFRGHGELRGRKVEEQIYIKNTRRTEPRGAEAPQAAGPELRGGKGDTGRRIIPAMISRVNELLLHYKYVNKPLCQTKQ